MEEEIPSSEQNFKHKKKMPKSTSKKDFVNYKGENSVSLAEIQNNSVPGVSKSS